MLKILDLLGFQYYDDTYPTVKEQKEFEKNLFNKTSRVNGNYVKKGLFFTNLRLSGHLANRPTND